MRGIFVCLALVLAFVGKAGLCVGYAPAQFSLGRSYKKGEGIDKDREKALYWYGKPPVRAMLTHRPDLRPFDRLGRFAF